MKVHIEYDNLDKSAENLKSISSSIDDVITNLNGIKNEVIEESDKHDNCYADTIDTLDELIIDYESHKEAVDFLQKQCAAASIAFKSTENENIDLSNKQAQEVLNGMAMMLGYDETALKNETWEEYTEDEFKNYQNNLDKYKKQIENDTSTSISGAWESIFDEDEEGVKKDSTGAKVAKTAESIIDSSSDDESPQPTPEPTPEPTPKTTASPGPSPGPSGGTQGGEVTEGENNDVGKNYDSPTYEDPGDEPDEPPKASEEPVDRATLDIEETEPTPTTPSETDQEPQQPPAEQVTQTENLPPEQGDDWDVVSGPVRSGGEYSESDGYIYAEEDGIETSMEPTEIPLEGLVEDSETSISDSTLDNIVKKNKYSKIPSSSTPIATQTTKSKGNGIIPIAAGLSAAAAAGIGAKAYIDRKKSNENGEDDFDSDDFESDEWSDDSMEIEYNDSEEKEATLDNEDDYSYQSMEQEKYGARNSEELADLQ